MEQIIKIGDKEVTLSNNVAWLMEYREQFNKDAAQEMIPLMATIIEALCSGAVAYDERGLNVGAIAEAVEGKAFEILMPLYNVDLSTLIINTTWAMAKAADETIPPPKKWVRQFETFPFDVVGPVLWDMNSKGFTSAKNLERLRTATAELKKALQDAKKKTGEDPQPSHLTPSSSQELNVV